MKLNQYGAANGIVIALIITATLLVASLIFGTWSFSGRQKYKDNTDQLISTAVSNAKQKQLTTDDQNFAVAEQKPLTEYVGPQAYGTVNLYYPKNWSAYINSTVSGGNPVDGYFYPVILPSVTDNNTIDFALRMQIVDEPYSSALQQYNDYQQSKQATVTAYSLPKLPSVVGVKVVGQLQNGVNGTLIAMPVRANTLEVWTEGTAYLSEFNNDILPNLTFSP